MVVLLATSSMLICFSPHYVFIIIQPAVYISTCFCMYLFWSRTYFIPMFYMLYRNSDMYQFSRLAKSPLVGGSTNLLDCGIYFAFSHPFFDDKLSVSDFVYICMLFQGVRLYTMMPNILCFYNIFLVSNLCSFYSSSFYFNK